MYESSNVGNPLLESIRLNKLILTLDNGGTSEWISHKETGFIYSVDDVNDLTKADFDIIAKDFLFAINENDKILAIKRNLLSVSNSKLWTWDERFKEELSQIENILKC